MVAALHKRWWVLLALVALLLGSATAVPNVLLADALPRADAPLQPQSIVVVNYPNGGISYNPADVRINVGDEVEWQGPGGFGGDFTSHPLVSDEGLWNVQNAGTTFTFKFTQAGLYHFHCQIHGPFGMVGTVLVVGNDRTYMPAITH